MGKTFRDIYRGIRLQLTPAQSFIGKIQDITGAPQRTIESWVAGRVRPNPKARREISTMLGIDEDTLFPEKPRKNRPPTPANDILPQ